MANTYSQVYLHFIFAPKFRAALIDKKWEDELFKYITGIVQKGKSKMLCINGVPDHIHMLIGFETVLSIGEIMQDVKAYSSKWINSKKFLSSRFEWQSGYGVFSYSKSQIPRVIRYIKNQKEHHKKKNFIEEYREFLEKFQVEFDERYIFKKPF